MNHSTARAPCCLPQNLFCPVFCGNPLSARQSAYAKLCPSRLKTLVIWLTPSMWRSRDGLSTILPKLLLLHQVVYIWGLTFFWEVFYLYWRVRWRDCNPSPGNQSRWFPWRFSDHVTQINTSIVSNNTTLIVVWLSNLLQLTHVARSILGRIGGDVQPRDLKIRSIILAQNGKLSCYTHSWKIIRVRNHCHCVTLKRSYLPWFKLRLPSSA